MLSKSIVFRDEASLRCTLSDCGAEGPRTPRGAGDIYVHGRARRPPKSESLLAAVTLKKSARAAAVPLARFIFGLA